MSTYCYFISSFFVENVVSYLCCREQVVFPKYKYIDNTLTPLVEIYLGVIFIYSLDLVPYWFISLSETISSPSSDHVHVMIDDHVLGFIF